MEEECPFQKIVTCSLDRPLSSRDLAMFGRGKEILFQSGAETVAYRDVFYKKVGDIAYFNEYKEAVRELTYQICLPSKEKSKRKRGDR